MAREISKRRYLSDIATMKELREARKELEMKTWYFERVLTERFYATFSVDNLISIVVPPGSFIERAIGWIETGMAIVRRLRGGGLRK